MLYRRKQTDALRRWFTLFFASISLASLTGGTVHGFFLNPKTLGYSALWPATLIAIGVTALAGWAIGADILFPPKTARGIKVATTLVFLGYCYVVLALSGSFLVAIIYYLPAAIFLSAAVLIKYFQTREKKLLPGIFGLLLTFIAALAQQARISIHPVYFNHNALFHLIQAAALYLIFRSALQSQW